MTAGDPLKKVLAGDKFAPKADTHNAFVDAAVWVRQQRTRNGAGGINDAPPGSQILVKNGSGADRARFDVLGISAPAIAPSDNEEEFLAQRVLLGSAPVASLAGKILILAEPLKDGEIGRAYVDGVCPAWINGEGDYCEIKDGEAGYLQAGSSGSARILWSEGGTGERWAVVLLGASAFGARWGKATEDWTEFSEVDVDVWTGVPSGGSVSDPLETVTCIAPGTDGTDMTGTIGLIIPVTGYGPTIRYQFLPLQCAPTEE